MIVYADILFAINFSMDFISMFITLMLLNKKIDKKKIMLSSIIGGIYGVFSVLYEINIYASLIINIAVSFIMCVINFSGNRLRKFLSMYIIFFGISAALAGFMSVFYSFLNKILKEYISDHSYVKVYNRARFFIISTLAMLVAIVFSRAFSKEKNIKSVVAEIGFNNGIHNVNLLCDSGNLLIDPLSGKKVILISKTTRLGKIIEQIEDIYKRYIPYNTSTGKGILKGIVPEYIKINNNEVSAVIAPVENKDFGGYEGCISTSLL